MSWTTKQTWWSEWQTRSQAKHLLLQRELVPQLEGRGGNHQFTVIMIGTDMGHTIAIRASIRELRSEGPDFEIA